MLLRQTFQASRRSEGRRCRGRKPRGAGSRGTEPGLGWGTGGICRRSAQAGVYKEHRSKANKKRRRTNMPKNAFPCHLKATVPCGRIYEPCLSKKRKRTVAATSRREWICRVSSEMHFIL